MVLIKFNNLPIIRPPSYKTALVLLDHLDILFKPSIKVNLKEENPNIKRKK